MPAFASLLFAITNKPLLLHLLFNLAQRIVQYRHHTLAANGSSAYCFDFRIFFALVHEYELSDRSVLKLICEFGIIDLISESGRVRVVTDTGVASPSRPYLMAAAVVFGAIIIAAVAVDQTARDKAESSA